MIILMIVETLARREIEMGKGFSEEGQLRAIARFHERRAQQDYDEQMKVEQTKEGHGPFSWDVFLGVFSSIAFVLIIYESLKALFF